MLASPLAAQLAGSNLLSSGHLHRGNQAGADFPIADHPRLLPRAPFEPRLLEGIAAPVGQFWSGANPGAIAFDVQSEWGMLRSASWRERGEFRRPLDPVNASTTEVSAIGWRPFGREGAAAGRVVVASIRERPGSFSAVAAPHRSNPLVVTDTSIPTMRRLEATLQGTLGWKRGHWGFGGTVGFDVGDHRTTRSDFPRTNRTAESTVAAGITRAIPLGFLAGVSGHWLRGNETIGLFPQPGSGVVYELTGYSEPDRREVIQLPAYLRRMDTDARGFGVGLSGEHWRIPWAAQASWISRRDGAYSERREDPATDRWRASGVALTAAASRTYLTNRLRVRLAGRYSRVRGEATRADLVGAIFRARETLLDGAIDIRAHPGERWAASVILKASQDSRRREDFIAEIASDVKRWAPGASLELARRLRPETWLSLSASASFNSALSTIPDPIEQGPVYQTLIAPELALYATQVRATSLGVTVRHAVRPRTSILFGAIHAAAIPTADAAVLFTPGGIRRTTALHLAVLLSPTR